MPPSHDQFSACWSWSSTIFVDRVGIAELRWASIQTFLACHGMARLRITRHGIAWPYMGRIMAKEATEHPFFASLHKNV